MPCPALFSSLPYKEFFGGVSGLTVEQFKKINGFPNAFWGWGGEDDDLWNRYVLRDKLLKNRISTFSYEINHT